MFNSELKKTALQNMKTEERTYENVRQGTIVKVELLHASRTNALKVLKDFDSYVNSLRNVPEDILRTAARVKTNFRNFEAVVHQVEIEGNKIDKIAGAGAGGGVLAGAGVAAFGPAAAMAVATTFGTASTGTAIATLSGAAATNAALAWLGGGALAAGGAGMSGGAAFLAMAGPVGWAIGGSALIASGLFANHKNKEVAEKAEKVTIEIKKEANKLRIMNEKVCKLTGLVDDLKLGLGMDLSGFSSLSQRDYLSFDDEQKHHLRLMMNMAESLSTKLVEKVS